MKFFKTYSVCACLLFAFLTSCTGDIHFQKSEKIPDSIWTYEDPLGFEFSVTDTSRMYSMDLMIAHAQSFSFQNLYMRVKTIFPSGEEVEETVSFQLMDTYGEWRGTCKGGFCRLELTLQENLRFPDPGKYRIVFEQFSRSERLEGIESITLVLENSENSTPQ